MSKVKANQILKANTDLKAKKLTAKSVDKFIIQTKERQDFMLSLKQIDERSLKAIVQL